MHRIHMYDVLSGTELTTILYDSLVLTVLQCCHIFTSVECSHAVAPVKLADMILRGRSIGLIRIRKTDPSTTPISRDEMSCVARIARPFD